MTIPLLSREISRGCTDAVAASRSLSVPDGRVTPQLSAEGYGEPQTRPANQTGQNEDLEESSTGRKPAEPTRYRDTLKVEFYWPEKVTNDANTIRGSVRGVGKDDKGNGFVISWGVDEFIHDGGIFFAKEPFYENSIVNKPESYGNMTQVLSSYESRHAPGEKPFQRGINSFQVLNDGKRWWIISIFWDSERPGNPLPAKFAKKN